MVVALTTRHWADLLTATDLVDVVGALEKSLGVDFSNEEDRFEYREVLAGLLSRWFSHTDLAAVTTALDGTSLLWSTYNTFTELVTETAAGPGTTGRAMIADNPMMHLIDQPGVGPHLAPGLPVALAGADRTRDRAPVLGEHTISVLSGLGLSDGELAELLERRIISDR